MPTDSLFYQLFLTFPNLMFELLNQSPTEGYEFCSREIKELAKRFDGIYLPSESQNTEPIYFIEVQFQEKADFWWRFIAEICVYLYQYQPPNEWVAVALFPSRKIDLGIPYQYQLLVDGGKIKIIYLDELEISEESSVGLDLMVLTVSKDSEAIKIAKKAHQKSKQQLVDVVSQTKVLELIETTLVYKLKNLTREEIEAMFTYDQLKDTVYFQQLEQESIKKGEIKGKLETVPLLIQLGMTVEEIAIRLDLPIETVRKASNN